MKKHLRAVIDESMRFAIESTSEATWQSLVRIYLRLTCIGILPCTILLSIKSIPAFYKNPAAALIVNLYYGLTMGFYGATIILWFNSAIVMCREAARFFCTLTADLWIMFKAFRGMLFVYLFLKASEAVPGILEALAPEGSLRLSNPARIETVLVSTGVWICLVTALVTFAWSDRLTRQKD